MSRRCERPGCSAAATVAYGFAAARQLAWLADLGDDRNSAGALCEAHAAAMVLPRGWWLDDRRTDEPTLFRAPEHRPVAPVRHHHHSGDDSRRRRGEARRPHEMVIGEQLALDEAVVPPPADEVLPAGDEREPIDADGGASGSREGTDDGDGEGADDRPLGVVVELASVRPAEAAAEPWSPSFDVSDDLGGLLDASTPLLARAFGRGRRSTTPPRDRG